jgi:hypothetical protein
VIVEIVSHWKVISIVGSLVLGAAGATYGYIESVDERIDAVEVEQSLVIEEVTTNRCIILNIHEGEEPLACLQD